MTAEILILSEEKARCYEPQGVEVCISITNPDGPPPRLSRRFRAVLRLSFSDIATPSPHPWDALFNEDHARQILAFIRRWYDADRLVIHCMAGLSRSPAVAMGVCELFGRSVAGMEQTHPMWNTWVRSELVRVGRASSQSP